jgi:hypothetical protein
MMLRSLLFWLLLTSLPALGQSVKDTIEVRKRTFRMHGVVLKPRNMLELMQPCHKAYEEMRVAKRNYDYGSAFAGVGGFLIGWPLGTAFAGGEPQWALAGVGAGLIAISIPFSSGYKRHARNAVANYNAGRCAETSQLEFGTTSSGIGLIMRF